MPRRVVPMLSAAFAVSRIASSSPCSGNINVVFSAIRRLSGVTSIPCFLRLAISVSNARGSRTTPLPMTDNFPGRTTPEGKQRELVGSPIDHQGVAGIMAALEADHDVSLLGQPIDDLPLPFVPPSGSRPRQHLPRGIVPRRSISARLYRIPAAAAVPIMDGALRSKAEGLPQDTAVAA